MKPRTRIFYNTRAQWKGVLDQFGINTARTGIGADYQRLVAHRLRERAKQ